MKCYRTLDAGICLDIITDETIFDAITEDGFNRDDFIIDVFREAWVEIVDKDEIIGVANFKQIYNRCYDAHIHILPEHRDKSKEAGAALWNWIEGEFSGCLIYTAVPEFCKNVRGFLLHFNFVESGLLEKAWLKNGELHNVHILTKRVE